MVTHVRCSKSLERERERLERALRDLRNEMASILHGSTPLKMLLDEAHLQGQINALTFAQGADAGGWPHDAWFAFIDARKDAVLSLIKAGKSYDEILDTLNLTEIQARLLVKLDEPDAKN